MVLPVTGQSTKSVEEIKLNWHRIGTFIGHKGAVWQARLSSDASLAATGSADFSAKVWDTHTGECLHHLQHDHIVRAVAFPPQSRPQLLATGGFEKKLRLFDLSRPSQNASSSTSSPTSPNGSGLPGPSSVFEIGPNVHGGPIKSVLWSSDPNVLITAADDKIIRWWDLRSRTPAAIHELEGALGSCEIDSASSTPSLSVAAGKSAYFFSGIQPGQLLKKVTTPEPIAAVALHVGQRKFVTGGAGDTWVRLFDLDDEIELDVQKGHHGPVWTVSFAPDGKLYATGSEDGTVKLWKFCSEPYGLWR
ncbi:MAG: hypothetical protein LQ351_003183 [Letrouitia transgressa]|nr:MAG: hypothetical protein LQ351_003183 [Letrouitia transgressa]